MTNSNKARGNAFEREFCELLSSYGFWAYNTPMSIQGQPADVIAAKNNRAYLIDCKLCQNDFFNTSRIEPNQWSAMNVFIESGNNNAWFALKLESFNMIYMVSYKAFILNGTGIYSPERIKEVGIEFERWVEYA